MARRSLGEEIVEATLLHPEQNWEVRPGRWIYQARWTGETSHRVYLVRVWVDVDRTIPAIVTAYRTSRVDKYWRRDS
jgi:hypothetical protein